ncbi:hypothetical protein GCM10010246_32760 [Streptomyces cuspidosporus]|uniref:Lipoprotein n=2 Tax=Streptomyces cuspidosporus TaxID=66882 RepID=A0ABN3G5B1_9ACTN
MPARPGGLYRFPMGASTRARTRALIRPGVAGVLALILAAAVSACGGPGPRPAPNSPTPPTTSAVELCYDLISYWAGQDLAGSRWAGLDWEQKGLSNQQYEIYDDVVRAARAERKRHGAGAARKLVRQETRRRCTAEHGATRSSENWRPPA